MFDFLKNLSHNHQGSPPLQQSNQFRVDQESEEDDIESHEEPNNSGHHSDRLSAVIHPTKERKVSPKREVKRLIRGDSIVGKMQKGNKAELDSQVVGIFRKLLKVSEGGLSSLIINNVNKEKARLERKVYVREMARDEDQYLEQASNGVQFQNYFLKRQLGETVDGIIDQISSQIANNQFQARLNRKRPNENDDRKMEIQQLIKQRESELHNKIGELNIQLQNEGDIIQERAHQIVQHTGFDPDSIKTKIAEEFVKNKQREREEKKTKIQELKQRKRQMQLKQKQEQQKMQEENKKIRHQKLIEQYNQKLRVKKQKEEKAKSEQLHFKQFLKQYKQQKPLYKQKEEEFQQVIKEEKMQRYYALKQKQEKYEPLNFQNIQLHEEKYDELRKEDRQRKKAELELAKEEEALRKRQLNQKVFKGKFRYLILQELVESDAKKKQKERQKQQILMKKQAYSLEVKERFKPTIDLSKRHQIEQLINSNKGRQRKYHTPNRVAYSDQYTTISSSARPPYSEADADPKQEGKKYHRIFKQYIRDKIEKGQIRNEDIQQKRSETIQPRPDYLKELRQKYHQKIPSRSTRLERQIDKLQEGDDYRVLMMKAEQFENRAKQREVKLRNNPHKPEQQIRLQQDYLCAIKAKMSLINHMD